MCAMCRELCNTFQQDGEKEEEEEGVGYTISPRSYILQIYYVESETHVRVGWGFGVLCERIYLGQMMWSLDGGGGMGLKRTCVGLFG